MWLFGRKKKELPPGSGFVPCSYCKSTNTKPVDYQLGEQPDYVKTWRGRRFITCRCLTCGRDFYADEPPGFVPENVPDDSPVDDPESLRAAEEELRRQVEEEDDRRFG